jgi:toxin FitB
VSFYVLDTNVISETHKPRPNPKVIKWLEEQPIEHLFTSSIVLVELRNGALVCSDEIKRLDLMTWIDTNVRVWLRDRIIEADEAVLLRWLLLSRRQQERQTTAPPVDMIIAAVAAEKNLIVATRDTNPFVACGIPTLNPFTGERFNGA